MRKLFPLLICIAILSSGCRAAAPIRELRIVETLGCDRAETGVTLSAQIAEADQPLRQTAPTIRLAMDRMRNRAASPALFFAHTQFLLLGQALAKTDLASVLDLVGRSADMRLQTPIFILYGGDAADAAALGDEKRTVTAMLTALREDAQRQGVCRAFTCGEILRALSERGAAPVAACAIDGETLRPFGYGVLRGGRLAGWISAPESQVVGLLMGLPEQSDIPLPGATLTVETCRTEITPQWRGGELTGLSVSLALRAALSETAGQPDITAPEERAALEAQLAETVRGWAETVLRRSQSLEADFLDLGGAVAAKSPGRWAAIRSDWKTLYPALPLRVTVAATLDRTQDLQAPLDLGGTP